MKILNASKDKFDIIIVAGQSNASGCGKGKTSTPWETNPRIMMLNEDFTADVIKTPYGDMMDITSTGNMHIDVADERSENGEKLAVFCLSFAKEYLENNLESDRKILLVQTAVGGTGFARKHWGENDKLAKRMYEMVDQALSMNPENRVVGVLWHQGEHDIFRNASFDYQRRYDFYYENFSKLIRNLREKYGENLPFISGGFCKNWLITESEESVRAVNNAILDVHKTISNSAHVIETDDLKSNHEVLGNGDVVHFCRDSSYELGKRYYKKFESIIKGV